MTTFSTPRQQLGTGTKTVNQPIQQSSLSLAQQRLWFLNQLEPDSSLNNLSVAIHLTGSLNVVALERSHTEILRRQEVLRSCHPVEDGKPSLIITPAINSTIPLVDLRECPDEQETKVQQLAASEAQKPFNLTQGPLWRTKLLRLQEERHIFLLTVHQIVADAESLRIFFQELQTFYDVFATEKPAPLPQLSFQYKDWINWQQQWLQSGTGEAQLAYWKQQLKGAAPVLELPTDHPRLPTQTFRTVRQPLELSKNLTEALRVSQQEFSLSTILLAAFKVLLHRYTRQEDIIVGSSFVNRNLIESKSLIGLFTNTLVLRTDLSNNPSFKELLARVSEVKSEAYANKDLPFEKLVEELQPERDLSYHPLFQVMFDFQNKLMPSIEVSGLSLSLLEIESEVATNLDLTLQLTEDSQGLKGYFEYNADLFDAAAIARMTSHFQTLLAGIVATPDAHLSDLPLLSAAERHQLLVEWNNTDAEFPEDICYQHLFEAQVERMPDAVAVVFQDQQLTYRELNNKANQTAHYLQNLGVKPDDLVVISVERSVEMVIGFLGILKAGGAYVPLDPTYPDERRAYLLADSQASVILTQERLVASLPEHNAAVVRLDTDWETIAQESEENLISEATAKNLAYVIYTSGSTGKPKGVMITHQGLVNHNLAIANQYDLKKSDRVLQFSSMSFDIIVEELFPSWLVGATVVLRTEAMLSSTTSFLHFIEREQISVLNVPTAFWHELVNGLSLVNQPLPASLRLVVVGGEKASRSTYLTWLELVGTQVRWLNSYGPTETTVVATVYDPACNRNDLATSEIPIGRAIANTQVYILDQYLQPVPIGVPGELHIGGAGLSRGYLNRPNLTANKFIHHPFADNPESRLYKTGDTVRYLPDGNIEFIGRIDFQVKIRGFRIELTEIEGALEQHPGVQQAVVMAREDVPGRKQLVAYVVLKPSQELTTSQLRSFLKDKLPDYMVPSTLVVLDTLPLTPNGKVDHRALPVPNLASQEPDVTLATAQDDLEHQLTQIWEAVLSIQPIGIQNNFFDLGGHSLLAIRLCNEIERKLGQTLSVATLFQAPTIEQLAKVLRQEETSAPCSSLAVIQPGNSTRLPLFCIHVLGKGFEYYRPLARYLDPEQPLYGLAAQMLDQESAPPNNVEDLAAYYIKEMQILQPQGPYFLAGVSFGGVVSFEMARQLHLQGQEVALLALFDTLGPGAEELAPVHERALRHLSNLLRFGPPYVLDRIKRKLETIYLKVSLQFGRSLPENLQLLALMEENDEASNQYSPKVYPGRITVYRATESVFYTDSYLKSGLGWGNLAAGGVEICDVPSDHLGILKDPHVKVLTVQLKPCLERTKTATPS